MESVLRQHEAAQAARPIYVFDLPPVEAALDDLYIKKSVGLRKLTMHEELEASDMSRKNSSRAGYCMLIKALVEVDGRTLDKANAEDERIVNNTDPSIRSLLIDAYTDLAGASEDSSALFLKSRKVKVV
jgi:hypothetical protein